MRVEKDLIISIIIVFGSLACAVIAGMNYETQIPLMYWGLISIALVSVDAG